MDGRTIILFGAKRSGSTAVFKMFQRHPDVGVCHVDQAIDNWEPNFWNLAASAIRGEPDRFRERFAQCCPFLGRTAPASESETFELWDRILTELGPVIFDKSPRYLRDERGLEMLTRYAKSHDVRFLGIVRDPRDVISSQFELWGDLRPDDGPTRRERLWVADYERLSTLQRHWDIPMFRYEDLVTNPRQVGPRMLAHAGLSCPEACLTHLRPINIGRHRRETSGALRDWSPGSEMVGLMDRYGYAASEG